MRSEHILSKNTISWGQRDGAALWCDDTLGALEVMATRLVRHQFMPHLHDTLMIGLIVKGAKRFRRDGKTFVAHPGMISIVNPGEWHTGLREEGDALEYLALYPTGQAGSPSTWFMDGVISDRRAYRFLWSSCHLAWSNAPRLERDETLKGALAQLAARHGDGRPERQLPACAPGVLRAKAYLDERFCQPVSIAELAQIAGLSPTHLIREFRRKFGAPMHVYQTQRRIDEAKRLLRTAMPIAEVGPTVGFADQSHLTKRFKSVVGVTPAAWRAAFV